jgi:hypothetical protein
VTYPSFVNAGGELYPGTPPTYTPALPSSRTTGNLLIAGCFGQSADSATYAVSGGTWAIFASNYGLGRPSALAYCYVTGSETAPTFTDSSGGTGPPYAVSQVYQYTGVVASSPIGNTSNNGTAGATWTCPGIVMTAANGLAINWDFSISGPSTLPSGWTSDHVGSWNSVNEKQIASQGGSSGSISASSSPFDNYKEFIFEIRSQAPTVASIKAARILSPVGTRIGSRQSRMG